MERPQRKRADGCITDLSFDSYFAQELEAADLAALEAHLSTCPHCVERRDALQVERGAFLLSAPTFARPVEAPRVVRLDSRRFRAPVAAVLAAAAALLIVFVGRAPEESLTRTKGAARVGFFVKHGEQVRRGQSGERVQAGDSLRFTYSSERPRFLCILSLDGSKHASVYYPAAAEASRVAAAVDEVLPTSVELDETLGEERIVSLFCDSAVKLEPLREALERDPAAFKVPDGCVRADLNIIKEARGL